LEVLRQAERVSWRRWVYSGWVGREMTLKIGRRFLDFFIFVMTFKPEQKGVIKFFQENIADGA
jgi:hypothetical protein